MDAKNLRNKLVGSDDERAVSPVIGVILMVAITVILAAVIATLVMDFGQGTDAPVNAVVDVEVDNGDDDAYNGEVTFTITDAGNAEDLVIRGASSDFASGEQEVTIGEDISTGEVYTVSQGTGSDDFAESDIQKSLSVVALDGDNEQTAQTFEVNFVDTS